MHEQTVLKVRTYLSTSVSHDLDEIADILGCPRPVLEKIVEEEIVKTIQRDSGGEIEATSKAIAFEAREVREIERSLRLHEDLGVNWAGVAIIMHLLQRLETLQAQLDRRLPARGLSKDADMDEL